MSVRAIGRNTNGHRHLLRRVAALTLALSMVLPLTPAFAYTAQNKPTKLETGEAPTIVIELNAVVSTTAGEVKDALTGELEVALWVKSGTVAADDGEGGTTNVVQPFNSLAVALEYSSLLTPTNFAGEAVDLTGTTGLKSRNMAAMETLKKSNLISTAGAMVSAKEAGGGYLVLTAEAHRPVAFKELTLLSVVTFRYDLEAPLFVANPPVAANTAYVGNLLAQPGSALSTNDNALIRFAPAELLDNTGVAAARELTYSSSTNDMYWSDVGYAAEEQEDGKPVPKLAIEAADPAAPTDETKFSKLSNLMDVSTVYIDNGKPMIEEHAINFSLVNKITYDDSKLKHVVTIQFYDWDDTQLAGTDVRSLVVPADQDAREIVNEFVKENMIHPDLQDNTNYDSLDRVDTYRGKYPSAPSAPSATDNTMDSQRTDSLLGSDYPLTNKLDYVFLKKNMAEKDGKWEETTLPAEDLVDGKDPYPYVHGWAVTSLNTVYSSTETDWTTLGVGELSGYGASAGITPDQIEFADFNFAKNPQTPGTIYVVKAVYEPGTALQKDVRYTITSELDYDWLTTTTAIDDGGGTYAIMYQYERIRTTDNILYGVSRAREPVVRGKFEPDVAGKGINKGEIDPFYMESTIENKDVIDVTMTPSSAIVAFDSALIDKYGLNFMTGGQRSNDGTLKEQLFDDNYDYDHYTFPSRFGTNGFILICTLKKLLRAGIAAVNGNTSELISRISPSAMQVMNIRKSETGALYGGIDIDVAYDKWYQMILAAGDDGYTDAQIEDLDWHQIQYYYLKNQLEDVAVAEAEHFTWCHLNDDCVSPDITVISDLETLLEAAQKAVEGNDASMSTLLDMNLIINELYLRQPDPEGGEPIPYTNDDLDDFKAAIIDVVDKAGTDELSWGQVQYALLHGNAQGDPADVGTAMDTEYWWYQGGEKIADWDDVIAAVKTWADGGYRAVLYTLKDNMPALMNLAKTATAKGDDDYSAIDPYTVDDFDALCTKLRQAVAALSAISIQNPTWDQVQFYILRSPLLTGAEMNTFGLQHFWWYDGGTLVTDIPSLRNGIVAARTGRVAAIEQLTADEINNSPLYIRNFDGTPFDASTFKTRMENIPATVNVTNWTWAAVQYYAIHGEYDASGISAESTGSPAYYWWQDGGTATTVPTIVSSSVYTFIRAAFLKVYNGYSDAVAWGSLTTDKINGANFRNPAAADNYKDESEFANLPTYTTMDVFKARMEALVSAALADNEHPHSPPNLTWYQVQKYLITQEYDTTSTETELDRNFWWKDGDNNPYVERITKLDELLELLIKIKKGEASESEVTFDMLNHNEVSIKPEASSASEWNFFSYALFGGSANLSTLLSDSTTTLSQIENLTWYQLQYAFLNGGAYTTDQYIAAYDAWAPSQAKKAAQDAGLMSTSSVNRNLPIVFDPNLFSIAAQPQLVLEDREEETADATLADQLTALAADPEALAAISDEEKAELLSAAQALIAALTEPDSDTVGAGILDGPSDDPDEQTDGEEEQQEQQGEESAAPPAEGTEPGNADDTVPATTPEEDGSDDADAADSMIEDAVSADETEAEPADEIVEQEEEHVTPAVEEQTSALLPSDETEPPDPPDTSQTTGAIDQTPQTAEGETVETTNTDSLSTAVTKRMSTHIPGYLTLLLDPGGGGRSIVSYQTPERQVA